MKIRQTKKQTDKWRDITETKFHYNTIIVLKYEKTTLLLQVVKVKYGGWTDGLSV